MNDPEVQALFNDYYVPAVERQLAIRLGDKQAQDQAEFAIYQASKRAQEQQPELSGWQRFQDTAGNAIGNFATTLWDNPQLRRGVLGGLGGAAGSWLVDRFLPKDQRGGWSRAAMLGLLGAGANTLGRDLYNLHFNHPAQQ